MKNKIIIAIAALSLGSSLAYAGVAYIDYKTGDFKCTSGYSDNLSACNENGISITGYEFCQKEVAKICN